MRSPLVEGDEWPYRLTVRTRPFQGCNRGSIPRRATMIKSNLINFVAFIRSRGVVGFAVGFILGKATSDLIGSFVADIINPLIGLVTGNISDLASATLVIGNATIKYGNFLMILINFIILAFVVYVLAKLLKFENVDKTDK